MPRIPTERRRSTPGFHRPRLNSTSPSAKCRGGWWTHVNACHRPSASWPGRGNIRRGLWRLFLTVRATTLLAGGAVLLLLFPFGFVLRRYGTANTRRRSKPYENESCSAHECTALDKLSVFGRKKHGCLSFASTVQICGVCCLAAVCLGEERAKNRPPSAKLDKTTTRTRQDHNKNTPPHSARKPHGS